MGQTVNLLAYAFGGSNPSSPTYTNNNNIRNAYWKRSPDGFLFSFKLIITGFVGTYPGASAYSPSKFGRTGVRPYKHDSCPVRPP